MQFLGRILDTVSSVSTLFSNPYRVRDVQLSDYNGKSATETGEQAGPVQEPTEPFMGLPASLPRVSICGSEVRRLVKLHNTA